MHRKLTAAVAILAVMSAGCGPAGSGEVVTEQRTVPAFDRISIEEGLDLVVEIVPGATQQVSVTYDDNLLHLIGTEVTDGELHIEIVDTFRITGGERFVTVVTGDLEEVRADSGADVRVLGEIDDLTVVATGGAALDLSTLQARHVTIDASGGAFAAVNASDLLSGTVTGGAEVMVFGDPHTIDVTTGGGGAVVTG